MYTALSLLSLTRTYLFTLYLLLVNLNKDVLVELNKEHNIFLDRVLHRFWIRFLVSLTRNVDLCSSYFSLLT